MINDLHEVARVNLAQQNATTAASINEPMKARTVLDPSRIAPAAAEKLQAFHGDTIDEIAKAIEAHPIVVLGMAQNPHVKNARKALKDAGLEFHYLEYGSYFSEWKTRLAIKLWSGWPTFPQVFVANGHRNSLNGVDFQYKIKVPIFGQIKKISYNVIHF